MKRIKKLSIVKNVAQRANCMVLNIVHENKINQLVNRFNGYNLTNSVTYILRIVKHRKSKAKPKPLCSWGKKIEFVKDYNKE